MRLYTSKVIADWLGLTERRMETVDGHEREGAVLPPRMQARRV